ncbi:MAG: YggT family protein [Litorimonas sp.]
MSFAQSILQIISMVLSAISFLLIIEIIMSYLFMFGILKPTGGMASQIYNSLRAFNAPILKPFRDLQAKIMPQMQQIDLSYIFALIAIWWIQAWLIGQFLWNLLG